MKTYLKNLVKASLSLSGLALAAALLGGSTQTSLAKTSDDPSTGSSFTWDLQSKGAGQRGLAFITFSNDQTFRGYQMWASLPPATNSSPNEGRGSGSSTGRGNSNGSSGKTNEFVFGFSPINGSWTMNPKGQIVGFFSVILNVTSEVTNYHAANILETITNAQTFDTTNLFVFFSEGQGTVTTNFAWATPPGFIQTYTLQNTNFTVDVASAEQTNSISFTGTSKIGKSLTLVCSTTFGQVTYKGVPQIVGPDISGQWFGTKRVAKQDFNELFTLVPFSLGNPFAPAYPDISSFPNIYFTTDGTGAGYTFNGIVMLSRKQIGFTMVEDREDGTLRSTIGSFKFSKKGASAKTDGIQEPLTRINFTADMQ
jgi:hypothetical protein